MLYLGIYFLGIVILYYIVAYWGGFFPFSMLKTKTGTIKGKVKIAGYENHAGISVRLGKVSQNQNQLDIDYYSENGKIKETLTDTNGDFVFSGAPFGNWWIIFEKKGYPLKMKLVTLKGSGKTLNIGTITLK
jgi:hypothetical protein